LTKKEIYQLVENDYKEIILTVLNIGAYGVDKASSHLPQGEVVPIQKGISLKNPRDPCRVQRRGTGH